MSPVQYLTRHGRTLAYVPHVPRPIAKQRYSARQIIAIVEQRYSLEPGSLQGNHARPHSLSRPRQLAMYLIRQYTRLSLPGIGRMFGMHFTTVDHAVRHVSTLAATDPEMRAVVALMTGRIRG